MRLAYLFAILGAAAIGCHAPQPPAPATAAPTQSAAAPVVVRKVTAADLGLPFYPGSVEKGSTSSVMDTPTDRTVICDRTVKGFMKEVANFYKEKLVGGHIAANYATSMMVEGRLKDGATVSIEIAKYSPSETEFGITVHALKKK